MPILIWSAYLSLQGTQVSPAMAVMDKMAIEVHLEKAASLEFQALPALPAPLVTVNHQPALYKLAYKRARMWKGHEKCNISDVYYWLQCMTCTYIWQ